MADPQTDPQDELSPPAEIDNPTTRQRLLVVPPPPRTAQRGRPVTSLAAIFGRFAEAQHQVGDQVLALEDSIEQQGAQLADLAAQLPDVKERINWLIANYYEDGRQSEGIRERLARQEAGLAALTEAVRELCEVQAQCKQTMDQLLQILGRAQ
jgi:septal ring factor EnvC (AmiA/AmiB activator)